MRLVKSMPILNLVIYGLTIIFVPIFSYLEKKPKMKLKSGIFFLFKRNGIRQDSRISYSEYLKIGSGSLLQKVEAGSSAGRNIHLNFYGRLFRELIPETFLICFYSDNRFKISSSHFTRLHFYLYCNQVFVENITSYKRKLTNL